uniref:Uncharacterized protein n=1 Tax=Glossina brevipalpis TaxID=37001 RepID=A0A1A9WM61_9MUSC
MRKSRNLDAFYVTKKKKEENCKNFQSQFEEGIAHQVWQIQSSIRFEYPGDNNLQHNQDTNVLTSNICDRIKCGYGKFRILVHHSSSASSHSKRDDCLIYRLVANALCLLILSEGVRQRAKLPIMKFVFSVLNMKGVCFHMKFVDFIVLDLKA